MNKKYDLEERLICFSISVIDVIEKMPKTYIAQYLFKQVARSSISPTLNYGEAQAAESRKDFVHKLKIVLKEMRETKNALELIKRKEFTTNEDIQAVQNECSQLIAIFAKSIETAKRNMNAGV
ncbi:MAG: four helix bundle protein [Fluviicola sp.]|nr:four helix bundle protein [Fluviicola sp.]